MLPAFKLRSKALGLKPWVGVKPDTEVNGTKEGARHKPTHMW